MEQREVADHDAASAARQIELEERRVLEARAAVNKRMGVGNAKSGPREAKALLPVPAALRAKIGATAAMNFEFQGAAVQAQRNALEHGLMCPSCGTLHDFKSKRCRLCTANVDWDKVRQSKELAMGKDKLGKEAKERLDGQNKVWAVEARPAGTCYPLLASHVELHQTALRPAGWAAPMEGKLPRTDKQAEVDATRMMMQISKVKGHDRRDRTKAVPSPFGGVTRGGGKGGEGGKGGKGGKDHQSSKVRFAGGTQAGNALVGAIRTQQLEEGRLEREDIERSLRKERQKEGKKTRFLQQASACYSVVGPSRKPSARVGPSGKRGDVVKKGKKGKKITSWSTKQTNVTAERSERHALLMEVASREQSMELARQAELMGILDPKELRRAREAVGILQAAGRDKVMRLQTELGTVTLMDEITYLQHTVGGAAPPSTWNPHREQRRLLNLM